MGRHDWVPVAAAITAVAWGGNEFTPLLVMYRSVSEFTAVTVNGLLAAYVIGIVPALLIGGPLSDILGRRTLMLPAAPLSMAGSILLAVGPTSPLMLGAGRILCGLALGLVMAVGTTWMKELSEKESPAAGARRASLALTIGFLVGAGVASALAQWAPFPTHASYCLHIILTITTGLWVLRVPETRIAEAGAARSIRPKTLVNLLRIPSVGHARFLRVVVPVAPWVFGCAGAAYAILPNLLSGSAHGVPIAFSGLMTVLTLGCGVGIQVLGRVIDSRHNARASVIAMAIITVGVFIGAFAAQSLNLVTGAIAAALMGMGYGLALVAGLSEVQRIATPADLAGLTAVYYSVAYLGFFIPMIFAELSAYISYPTMFLVGSILALVSLLFVASAWKAHLPAHY
ncbi:MFS transporter [Corynebacterium pacaense]|uniref:MFS transporter n=1 Tax=Corynebacterium pacaense TaxID=1816684 RepID=UPI0031834AD2